MHIFRITFILLCLFALLPTLKASHIIGGEITVQRLSESNTYLIRVTGYRDKHADVSVIFGKGTLDFGDGGEGITDLYKVTNPIVEDLSGGTTEKVEFKIFHTYHAPGDYLISYKESYRNANVLNLSKSDATDFYVETLVVIDPYFGLNSSPQFTIPGVGYGAVGAVFRYNPGAYDPDGDSLSYRFVTPKQDRDDPVAGYKQLNDPKFYTDYSKGSAEGKAPTLSLNSRTGELIWDAPGDLTNQLHDVGYAEYNIAIVVEEWRKVLGTYYRIGSVTRDMQITIYDTDNESPVITKTGNICEVGGNKVEVQFKATDGDAHPIKMEAFGELFQMDNGAVILPSNVYQSTSPAVLKLTWNTTCDDIRLRPYQIYLQANDLSFGPALYDYETIALTIGGPKPTGFSMKVVPERNVIQLKWDTYSCSNAQKMQVWKKKSSLKIAVNDCAFIGMPAQTGYELVDEIDINVTSFEDAYVAVPGLSLCYLLVAKFPAPNGGFSYVSEELCHTSIIDAPVITKVNVLTSSSTQGEMQIQWTSPFQSDKQLHPRPYTYKIFRRKSNENQFNQLATVIQDTVYTDRNQNTESLSFAYYVEAYDKNGVLINKSASAASVALQAQAHLLSVALNWSAVEVPWSLKSADKKHHYIYRNQVNESNSSEMVLIDSVDVTRNRFEYFDNGSFNGQSLSAGTSYCYQVVTFGTYGNPVLASPLVNQSQTFCIQPNPPLGNSTVNQELLFEVFPNPFGDQFWIKSPVAFSYSIYDISGQQLVVDTKLLAGQHRVGGHLESGVYFIVMKSEGGSTIKRIVKSGR
jgi:hypothetical protein